MHDKRHEHEIICADDTYKRIENTQKMTKIIDPFA